MKCNNAWGWVFVFGVVLGFVLGIPAGKLYERYQHPTETTLEVERGFHRGPVRDSIQEKLEGVHGVRDSTEKVGE